VIVTFTGEPKSTQQIYRNTCRGGFSTTYRTPEGKALKEQYQWESRTQWKGKPLEGDIEVSITLFFGTKRRADLDNFNQAQPGCSHRHCVPGRQQRELNGLVTTLQSLAPGDPERTARFVTVHKAREN